MSPINAQVRSLLLLEDDLERVARFRAAVGSMDATLQLFIWRTAWSMIEQLPDHLSSTVLISLVHDLIPLPEDTQDPGDGLEVAKSLAAGWPSCPIIVHSSNGLRAQAMIDQLDQSGWQVERVAPIGDDWVENYWQPVAMELLAQSSSQAKP